MKSVADRLAQLFDAFREDVAALLPDLAREQLTAALGQLGAPPKREKPPRPAKAPKSKPTAPKNNPAPRSTSGPRCGKCKQSGHNARTCSAKKPAAADPEDEPRVQTVPVRERKPVQCTKCHREGHNARTCDREAGASPPEEHVIPHAALVRMLAADRAENAVGDAGGFVARNDQKPRIVGHAERTREVCHAHGWVGRHAFERDQHELCDPVGAPCSWCGGGKFMATSLTICDHCYGTGVEPAQVEDVPTALVVSEPSEPRTRSRRRELIGLGKRSKSIMPHRITRAMLAEGGAGLERELAQLDDLRPKTRAECADGPRPCPWASCKHHLYLDINPETGSIKINFPDREIEDLEHTCALDVAEGGVHTLEQVGAALNVTRERLRQIEVKALQLIRVDPRIEDIGTEPFFDRKEIA